MADQHIYHHNENSGPHINVKAERNSRGWNYEATIMNAESIEQAMELLLEATARLDEEYGPENEKESK